MEELLYVAVISIIGALLGVWFSKSYGMVLAGLILIIISAVGTGYEVGRFEAGSETNDALKRASRQVSAAAEAVNKQLMQDWGERMRRLGAATELPDLDEARAVDGAYQEAIGALSLGVMRGSLVTWILGMFAGAFLVLLGLGGILENPAKGQTKEKDQPQRDDTNHVRGSTTNASEPVCDPPRIYVPEHARRKRAEDDGPPRR